MKKKLMCVVLAAVMVFSLAGCGNKETKEEAKVKTPVASCDELLNKIWDNFGDDLKFPVMGGDFGNPVDNAAGIFNIGDVETLTYMLYIPADNVPMIDEAASLIHAMNTNTFTGAAFHLADAGNGDALAQALKDNITTTQWMCGFPEKLVIFTVNGEYVVSAFGNGEIIENFKTKLTEVYGEGAVLVTEENLM